MFRTFKDVLVLGGALFVLTACTSGNHMVATAKDTNLALEESTNQMLLLNIIRASQQKPMYFTGLADVSVIDTARSAGALSVPFGRATSTALNFSPSFTLEAKPSFKVQILDNKEFIKAIHTPVTLETFGFFLSLGWPPEFLLYMFTESVVVDKTRMPNIAFSRVKVEKRYGNKAHAKIDEKQRYLDKFKKQIKRLKERLKVITVDTKRVPAGPVLAAAAVEQKEVLTQILALNEKGISLNDACQIKEEVAKGESDISLPEGFLKRLDCDAREGKKDKKEKDERVERKYIVLKEIPKKALSYGTRGNCTVTVSRRTTKEQAAPKDGCAITRINFRSPQGMLYFLGKIVRAYVYDDPKPNEKPNTVPSLFGRDVSLFAVRKGQADGKTALSVEYDGETYSVPATENHLSMMSLSLISQLISLLKDPKNIPASSTVNIFAN